MRLGFGLAIIGAIVLVAMLGYWAYLGTFTGYAEFCVEQDFDGFVQVDGQMACAKLFDSNVTWRLVAREGNGFVFVGDEKSEPLKQDDFQIDVGGKEAKKK